MDLGLAALGTLETMPQSVAPPPRRSIDAQGRQALARAVIGAVALAVVAATVASLLSGDDPPSAGAQTGAARPNVVVVMTDDQTAESMRVMRNVRDLLIERGTSFTNAYATFPLCCPSRATYLTGQYAHNHGVLANTPPRGGYERFDDSQALPVLLRRSGYVTGHVGKYLNGYGKAGESARHVPRGWHEWLAPVKETTFAAYDYTLNENARLKRYGDSASDYKTDVFVDEAVRFIGRRAADRRPFFLSLAPTVPHIDGSLPAEARRNPIPAPRHRGAFRDEPLPTPPSFDEADVSDKPEFVRSEGRLDSETVAAVTRRYRSELESLLAVDDAVGAIVRKLATEDVLDHTLIVFTSDNGYFHGQHRIYEGKDRAYEEAARVPLVVRGPGFPAGVEREQLAGNIDLAPTILDVADARAGPAMDGRSLVPLAASSSQGTRRDLVLEGSTFRALRTPEYLYARQSTGEEELYDLARDPFELDSQHASPTYGAVRDRLRARLRALKNCSGMACR